MRTTNRQKAQVRKEDRRSIHVHYVPAKRNPGDHIRIRPVRFSVTCFGRPPGQTKPRRSLNLTKQISSSTGGSDAISSFNQQLKGAWSELHKGSFFAEPKVSFERTKLARYCVTFTISFAPGHENP